MEKTDKREHPLKDDSSGEINGEASESYFRDRSFQNDTNAQRGIKRQRNNNFQQILKMR